MKYLIIVLLLVSGCGYSEKQKQKMAERGELRHDLFIECMKLSGKIERQGDDDVSDIISECDNVAYYMANQMYKI